MCGICGYIGKRDRDILTQMGDVIYHRGPDAGGYAQVDGVNLCSRRLSILDLAGGAQPVFSKDRTICMVWNGEIYNYKELQKELEQDGVDWDSDHSDTELLLHLYEKKGFHFLDQVNGMFAIALYDQKKQKLFLVRDRMGVKPLYYEWNGIDFIFASEMKAIFKHPAGQKKIRIESLYQFFSYHTVCSPDTLYKNIYEVPPATLLEVDLYQGKAIHLTRKKYWMLEFDNDQTTKKPEIGMLATEAVGNIKSRYDEEAAIQQVRELLADAVKIRMQADVEIGSFLSGGLDSSLATALMMQQGMKERELQKGKVRTYSLGYTDVDAVGKEEDVSFAEQLARQWNSKHTLVRVGALDMISELPKIQSCFDQPFSANVAPFFLTKQMGKEIKCALSGDGADELFGSYYGAQLAASGKIPVGKEAAIYEGLLNCNDELKGFLLSEEVFGTMVKEKYTTQKITDQVNKLKAKDPVNRFLEYQWNSALVDQVLTYTDRLSMAHSLEVRSPFLDYRLVEAVAKMPGNLKMKHAESKYLLKKAAEGILPQELIYRKKEMFFPPVHMWMVSGMKNEIMEKLSESQLRKNEYLNEKNIQYLLHRFYQNPNENAKMGDIIWNLYCFQVWLEN